MVCGCMIKDANQAPKSWPMPEITFEGNSRSYLALYFNYLGNSFSWFTYVDNFTSCPLKQVKVTLESYPLVVVMRP